MEAPNDDRTKIEQLAELQNEAQQRVGLLLGLHSVLLGFSAASLLALIAAQPHGFLTTVTCCSLVLSTIAFGLVVLGRILVLHKGSELHIGHIILAEDFSGRAIIAGVSGLIIGFALLVAHISIACTVFLAVCLFIAVRWHSRFKAQLDKMPPAHAVMKSTTTSANSSHGSSEAPRGDAVARQ